MGPCLAPAGGPVHRGAVRATLLGPLISGFSVHNKQGEQPVRGSGDDDHAKPDIPTLLIVIGASAGGLDALTRLLDRLPPSLQATVVIATHRPPDSPGNRLAEILRRYSGVRVDEPEDGESLDCATLLVGAPSEFVTIEGDRVSIDAMHERAMRMRRIDALFESAAEFAGPNSVGVVLSGTLWDGTAGLRAISDAGGYCLIQDPDDAQFPDMPMNAIRRVEPTRIGTAEQLAKCIVEIASERRCI